MIRKRLVLITLCCFAATVLKAEDPSEFIYSVTKMVLIGFSVPVTILVVYVMWGHRLSRFFNGPSTKIEQPEDQSGQTNAIEIRSAMEFRVQSRFNARGDLRYFLEYRYQDKNKWKPAKSYDDMLEADTDMKAFEHERDQLDDSFTEKLY